MNLRGWFIWTANQKPPKFKNFQEHLPMTSQSLFSLSDNFLPEETGSGNTGNKFTGFWGLGWFKICMLAAVDEGSYKLKNIFHSFHFHEFFENIPRLTHRVMNWIMHWSIGGRWFFGGLLWWNGLSLTLGSVFIGSGITSTSGSGPLVLILGSGKKIGNPIVWIHTFFWSLTYAHNNFFTVFLNLLSKIL